MTRTSSGPLTRYVSRSARPTQEKRTPPPVSLYAHSHGRRTPKTNEIPVSIELLKAFDVANTVITTDALLTQRQFCQHILDHHADYCLPVKANQRQLYEDIRDLFEPFNETDPPEVECRCQHRR